ncbi:MAG: LemA family protein [Magnetococcales bacterium]|nr:LemA family protein [Magnetococcales bacterium]
MAEKDTLKLDDLGPDSANSERMRRMKRMMRELYKEEFETKRFRLPPIKAKSLIVTLSFVSMIVFGVTTLYNFNRFVTLEERVLSANGHVEDVLQRRVNLFENLINLTLNQSALEQEVFRHVADVRSSIGKGMSGESSAAVGGADGEMLDEGAMGGMASALSPALSGMSGLPAMARLLAVVEQYPEIRSSVTYQQLMDKLVEIENRIAKRRDEFNEEVRIYNTLISSFPWYVLARVTGFKRYHYFSLGGGMNTETFQMPNVSKHTFRRLLPVAMGEKVKRSEPQAPTEVVVEPGATQTPAEAEVEPEATQTPAEAEVEPEATQTPAEAVTEPEETR